MNKLVWLCYAVDYVLRDRLPFFRKNAKYCKCTRLGNEQAGEYLSTLLESDKPFAAGRLGLFELAVMRMYEFGKKDKYELVMNNLYNCAGFFPNDTVLGARFTEIMKDSLTQMDFMASNENLCENYFFNKCLSKNAIVSKTFDAFEICKLQNSWTRSLKGKKVLVVTPFTESVEFQYQRREKIFPGTEILPEFKELLTYRSLMTIGDMKDDRFETWFDALEFMKKEILAMDFDVALLGCGAYGFPLAAEIKKAGKQAIHMGGVLQILFGIMGKRWDGTRKGGPVQIREDIAKYYNENWIYPMEKRPDDAGKVEYGPYWK